MPVLSDELRRDAETIMARYPERRSAMLPLLYLLQSAEGHLSREGMQEVGELLGLHTAEVEAVATFYTMLRVRPSGRYVVAVCTNVSGALPRPHPAGPEDDMPNPRWPRRTRRLARVEAQRFNGSTANRRPRPRAGTGSSTWSRGEARAATKRRRQRARRRTLDQPSWPR